MTKLLKCACPSKFQDEKHGVGNRVHNKTMKKEGAKEVWRCAKCLKERTA